MTPAEAEATQRIAAAPRHDRFLREGEDTERRELAATAVQAPGAAGA
jgi:hypothetical protein